jgi:hypothetical protein
VTPVKRTSSLRARHGALRQETCQTILSTALLGRRQLGPVDALWDFRRLPSSINGPRVLCYVFLIGYEAVAVLCCNERGEGQSSSSTMASLHSKYESPLHLGGVREAGILVVGVRHQFQYFQIQARMIPDVD